jgi:hypothetical protein
MMMMLMMMLMMMMMMMMDTMTIWSYDCGLRAFCYCVK